MCVSLVMDGLAAFINVPDARLQAHSCVAAGAATHKEFARYLDIAIKSANETEHHLLSARELELVAPDDWRKYTAETVEIRKMTYAYRRKVLDSARH